MGICLLYSTHPTPEQARATATALLDARQAACCNMLVGMESHYRWQGKPQTAAEVAMLSKTTEAQALAAIATIKALHPYECPAILQLPVMGGYAAFLDWIAANCGEQAD